MTVETNDTVDRWTISGTGPYTYSFRIFSESELTVHVDTGALDPVLLTLSTHYTVSGVDDEDGGTITLTSDAATLYDGDTIDIRSNTTEYQPTSIRNQGRFLPEIHEDAFDRLNRQIQDLSRRIDRKFGYPDNTILDGVMVLRSSWAEKWVYVNSDGEFEPAAAISPQALSQSIIGNLLHPRTSAEIAAGVTPVDYARKPYEVLRQGADSTGVSAVNTAVSEALSVLYDQGANHTEATQIGGVLRFPIGIYRLTSTVTIDRDGVVIEGDPGGGTVIYIDGAFPGFTVDSGSLQKIYGVQFRNLRFRSSITDRSAGSAAIKFVGAENFRVRDCTFHLQTQYGIWLQDTIVGRVMDCDFDSGDWQNQGMSYGVYGDASDTVSISTGANIVAVKGCSFRYTTTAGVALLGSPVYDPPTNLRRECAGITVGECDFEHNFGDGIQLLRNRAATIYGCWFEDNGIDAATGHGHIIDLSVGMNESFSAPANSGLNASVSISGCVFGGHDNANADFLHIGLEHATSALIEQNYFSAGIISTSANCRGLTIRNNWSSQGEPTLAGALPASRIIHDNFDGPTSVTTNATRWVGSFQSFDSHDTPVAITATTDATPSIIDSTVGKVKTFVLAATGALTITQFDDAQHGDVLNLIWANANTTLQNTTGNNGINLAGQANFTGATKDTMTLMYVDGGSSGFTARWFEIGRTICTPQTYTATNVTTDRSFDADTVTVAELADVVGTMLADLRSAGIVK